jgi:hypothetical protein
MTHKSFRIFQILRRPALVAESDTSRWIRQVSSTVHMMRKLSQEKPEYWQYRSLLIFERRASSCIASAGLGSVHRERSNFISMRRSSPWRSFRDAPD